MNWIRFIFGACWASFITTIVWRHWLNHDRPYPPYSQCENCGRRLRAWQLVPVIGWLLQGGRCRNCYCQVSPFWPLSELASGLALIFLAPNDWLSWGASLLVVSALLALATTDWACQWICPWLLVGLLPLALLTPPASRTGFDLALALCWILVARLPGLGSGDGDFLCALTLLCGGELTCWTVLAGSLLTLADRRLYARQPLPLVPYLAAGWVLALGSRGRLLY